MNPRFLIVPGLAALVTVPVMTLVREAPASSQPTLGFAAGLIIASVLFVFLVWERERPRLVTVKCAHCERWIHVRLSGSLADAAEQAEGLICPDCASTSN